MRLIVVGGTSRPNDTSGVVGATAYSPTQSVCILSNNDASRMNDPTNIANIKFHSDLFGYFSIVQEIAFNITLSAHGVNNVSGGGGKKESSYSYNIPYSGTQEYAVASINYPFVPVTLAYDAISNRTMSGAMTIIVGSSTRTVNLVVTQSSVSASETYVVLDNSLPAQVISGVLYIFDQGINGQNTLSYANEAVHIDGDRVVLGNGKLDSHKRYMKIDSGGAKMFVTQSIVNRDSWQQAAPMYVEPNYNHSWAMSYSRIDIVEDGVITASTIDPSSLWNALWSGYSGRTIRLKKT